VLLYPYVGVGEYPFEGEGFADEDGFTVEDGFAELEGSALVLGDGGGETCVPFLHATSAERIFTCVLMAYE
jgi:hypothetical protein